MEEYQKMGPFLFHCLSVAKAIKGNAILLISTSLEDSMTSRSI